MKQEPLVVEATPAVDAERSLTTLTVLASNEGALCIDGVCELPSRQ